MTGICTTVKEFIVRNKIIISLFGITLLLNNFWKPYPHAWFDMLWENLINDSDFGSKIMIELFFNGLIDWFSYFYYALSLGNGYGLYVFFISVIAFTCQRAYIINSTGYHGSGLEKIIINYLIGNTLFSLLARLLYVVLPLFWKITLMLLYYDSGHFATAIHILIAVVLCSIVLYSCPGLMYFITVFILFFISLGLISLLNFIMNLLNVPIFLLNSILVFSALTLALLAGESAEEVHNKTLKWILTNASFFLPKSIVEYFLDSL